MKHGKPGPTSAAPMRTVRGLDVDTDTSFTNRSFSGSDVRHGSPHLPYCSKVKWNSRECSYGDAERLANPSSSLRVATIPFDRPLQSFLQGTARRPAQFLLSKTKIGCTHLLHRA